MCVLICKCFTIKETLPFSIWVIRDKGVGNPTSKLYRSRLETPLRPHIYTQQLSWINVCSRVKDRAMQTHIRTLHPDTHYTDRDQRVLGIGRWIKDRERDTYQLT